MVPSNNDWLRGCAEESCARPASWLPYSETLMVMLPAHSFPGAAIQREKNDMMIRRKTGRLILRKGRMPPSYDSVEERFCAKGESFKTAIYHFFKEVNGGL